MAQYVSRDAALLLATASTWYPMVNMAGETRNDVIVPPNCHSIKQIIMSLGMAVGTDAKGCLVGFRIRGLGYTYETLAGGWSSGTVTGAGGYTCDAPSTIINTNLAVTPGQSLTLEGCQITAADAGTATLAVTLVFDTNGGAKRWSFIRWASNASLDAKGALTLDGVGATVNQIQFPGNVKRITNIVGAIGGITLATATGGTSLIRLEGGMKEGDVVFTAGSHAALVTTRGKGPMVWNANVIPTDLEIDPAGVMWCYGEQTGVDWGTPYFGVAVEVE